MNKKPFPKKIVLSLCFIGIILLSFLIVHHIKKPLKIQYTFNESSIKNKVIYPDVEFAVISDLHFYNNSLGTTGSAFEEYLKSDRKLLKDSNDLLNLAIKNILKSNVKFVLVSGDLTKDGELINHQDLSKFLSRLTEKGIKVYVVPGNHDVNNPLSYKYQGDKKISIDTVSSKEFSQIYKNHGYDNALYRDNNSLSYVAEPVNGLWLVALDTCRYKENEKGKEAIVGGSISQDEEKWLSNVLNKAKENKKAIMVLQHHGVVEHWKGQSKLHKDYLVEDYKNLGKMLSSYNVKLAFTGHYHAQDIAKADFNEDKFIYDIETGSLITAPCPIRYCSIKDNKLTINTDNLIDKLHPGTDFAKNANEFIAHTIFIEAYNTLLKYKISKEDSKVIADYVTKSFLAHYNGDEKYSEKPIFDERKLSLWGKIVYSRQKYIIDGLWQDLPPKDNNLILDLDKN